jgi:hypothetical protein
MDRWVLVLWVALVTAFTWPLWTNHAADRQMIGPPDGDFLRQFYPYRAFVARAWAAGQPPLLNPHQYAGTPAWADPQQAVLYPWRLTQVPLALGGRALPLGAVALEAAAHLVLGGLFTYLLLRALGARAPAALLAALAFGFGGYLTGYPLEQLAVLDTAIWIPALLAALTAAIDRAAAGQPRPARRWALAAGVALALMLLAGHPQTALYGLYAAGAWWLWRARSLPARQILGLGAVWLAAGLGLAAAQWLPSAQLVPLAARQLDPGELLAGLAWRDALQWLAPAALTLWSPLFVGVVPLALALWGAWRLAEARFWVVMAAVAWLVALGGHGPVLGVLLRLAPGFALFRHHERAAVLVSLALAVVAGLALDRLLAGPPELARGALAVSAALAGLAALAAAMLAVRPATELGSALADGLALSALMAGLAAVALALRRRARLSPRALAAALALLAAFQLFSVNRGQALAPRAVAFPPDAILDALRPVAREGRVSSEGRLPGGPNAASVAGLYDVTGDSPLQLERLRTLQQPGFPEMLAWRLLGVRFLVTGRTFEPGAPLTELARSGDSRLYRVELPVPPVWVVPADRARPAVPAAAADRTPGWADAALDPQAEILLEPAGLADQPAAAATAPGGQGTAALVGLDPVRARVEAVLDQPGWVVLSTIAVPGWRAAATVPDGRAIHPAVRLAYGALPAVLLPAGRWMIEWTYRPFPIIVGLVVSAMTVLWGGLLWRR